MTDLCLVLTTCGSETIARAMAMELVDLGLVASVNLQPVQTCFRLDGRTLEEEGIQLMAVTTSDRYAEVEACMLRLHTFEAPDVFMVRLDRWAGGA